MVVIGATYLETARHTQRFTRHYKHWQEAGVFEEAMRVLHEEVRAQAKKASMDEPDDGRFASGKEHLHRWVESKGFYFYQATNGIKRHLVVDSLGFPFFTACTPANVSDDAAVKPCG